MPNFNPCFGAPIPFVPNLFPVWTGWKHIPDNGFFPFLTDVGCAAASSGGPLYVAAQRSPDHTIWLNSTSDPYLNSWDGWHQAPPLPNGTYARTPYSPSV